MALSRRTLIHHMIVAAGGSASAAQCAELQAGVMNKPKAGVLGFYTPEQARFLTRLCDLILPQTDTASASQAGVVVFMDSLMSEWASANTRRARRAALLRVSSACQRDGLGLAEQDPAQALDTLTRLDTDAFRPASEQQTGHAGDEKETTNDQVYADYRGLKSTICQAYFVSQPGAADELDWRLVPGRWDPCVSLESTAEAGI